MLVYSASRSRKSSPSLPSRSCRHTDTQQRQGTACRHSSQPGRGGQRATRHTNPADRTFDDSTLLLTQPPCSTSEAHQLQRRHLGLHLLLSQRLPTLSRDGDSSRQLQGACGVQWVGGTARGAQVCNSRAGRCTVPSRRGPVSGRCTAGETWRRYFNPFEGTAACALSPWAAMLLHRTTPCSLTHIVLPDVAAALNTATPTASAAICHCLHCAGARSLTHIVLEDVAAKQHRKEGARVHQRRVAQPRGAQPVIGGALVGVRQHLQRHRNNRQHNAAE